MKEEPRKKRFGSFKDLARSEGRPVEQPKPSGWSFVSPDSAAGQARSAEELAAAAGDSPRQRVARRPQAFGAMDTGPACYRDEGSEEMRLLASFRVRTFFPGDVKSEVRALPRDPSAADRAGRLDLREQQIFTIDGDDAKDFDDAIGMRELGGGRVELGVHIADVSHYVRPGTALDAEALARATSIYLPDQVVPMLPEELSNHLCSLVEGRDRLTYSVIMVFDAKGKRLESRVAKSVIRSVKRCTYAAVQQHFDGQATPEARALAPLGPTLELLKRWTTKQQALRDARGSLRMQGSERRFEFDSRGEVRAIVDYPKYFSMALIEETALAANQAVGDLFRARGLPTIYRVHPEKDPEEIAAVGKLLAEHGIRVPAKERLTARDIGHMIRAARGRPNADALIQRIMSLIERAVYEVRDHADVATHFGLAREAYLHFTSPIRRYPDLVVHRWLTAIESRGEEAARELRAEELVADLNEVALHSSAQAEMAEMAAFAVGDLKVCQFMEPHVGERLKALVQRVSPPGLVVDLVEYNVTGFLPSRTLGDRVKVEGPTITIGRGKNVRSFTEGHPVAVRLKDIDFERLQLLLELA
jgi:ribonuclease R